jgi:5-methylcytosine-specific restriction protein A
MPRSAPTPCRQPGCPQVLATPGYCDQHRGAQHRDYGRARRGFDEELGFYRTAAWRSARAALLREEPLCRACRDRGRLVPATIVDHVRPIKDGGARFDAANLQPLCAPCHNRKTARETARANAGLRGRSV